MARSSLYALKNATARFVVASSGTTEDTETGNIRPKTQNITVDCFLNKEVVNEVTYPGVSNYKINYIGRVVSPGQLDARIQPGVKCYVKLGTEPEREGMVRDCRYNYGNTGILGNLGKILGESIYIEAEWQS